MRPIALPESQPWQRLEAESDTAWEAFNQYLQLPSRKVGRRVQTDLVELRGCTNQTINKWYKAWHWEERAAAYDAFLSFQPAEITEIAERRKFAGEIRDAGSKFRRLSEKLITLLLSGEVKLDDAVKVYKLGVDMQERADRIEQPVVKGKKNELNEQIRELLTGVTRGMGGLAAGGAGATVTATERTVSFDLGNKPGQPAVREVQAIPGEVRDGGSGSSAD